MVWVETPTNPMLKLADLQAIARICRERASSPWPTTLCQPMVQRPLEHGFDIVVHSTTKYLNGHSDIIGGIAVGGEPHQKAWRDNWPSCRIPWARLPARSTASSPCAA
jgi:cystathionine gamma-lyase